MLTFCHLVVSSPTASHEWCFTICQDAKTQYMGLEGGNQCFCGSNDLSSATQSSQPWPCEVPCDGDSNEACGGVGSMGIWEMSNWTPPSENVQQSTQLQSQTPSQSQTQPQAQAATTAVAEPSSSAQTSSSTTESPVTSTSITYGTSSQDPCEYPPFLIIQLPRPLERIVPSDVRCL